MSINFDLSEKKVFNHSYEIIKDNFDLDFEKLARESKFIDSFDEIRPNIFEIRTAEKSIMSKKLFLKTTVAYIVNKDRGLIHLISQNKDDDNLNFDCKIRMIPDSNNTVVALKFDGNVDFGFSKIVNKGIQKYANKEIEKFLTQTINSFDKEAS